MIGVVILYYPDQSEVVENINTYIHALSHLLVYDNSESYNQDFEKSILKLNDKISYIYFGKNEGIAVRLNQAVRFAKVQGAEYLLTMDQDSSFKNGDFERYLQHIKDNKLDRVAQFGINCQPHITPIKAKPEITISLITSGSVLLIKNMDQIGEFDENLFIDLVDISFSFKVTNQGFSNVLCSDIILNHNIGTYIQGRSLLTFKRSQRIIHNPIRVYYIIRNGLYLLFKTKGLSSIQRKEILRTMLIVKNDLIYNPNLLAVYINIYNAFVDFLINKMQKKN
jgi:rhamnosyltransferase